MEQFNYEWFIITQTVEAILPRFTHKTIGLTMIFDINWNNFSEDSEEQQSFSKKVLLLFHRPSNYTKVLFKDITNEKFSMYTHEEIIMKQLSDHDSCWRSDGCSWIFSTFVEAWSYFESLGVDGRKIDPSFHWSLFSGSPEYHKVSLELINREKRWTSDYKVVIGRKVPLAEISKYMPKEN
jgi:hypothetical protein